MVQGGRILARMPVLVTRDYPDHELLLKAIRKTIEELREHNSEVAAVGAGLPGMIDSINGRVYQLSNVAGWEDVPLTALLEEWTGLPAAIDNDANAMAYAEWIYGAGNGGVNVVCVTFGTGVGGGLILDGKLYRGSQLGAGEIGQMMIDPDGPKGQYGNDGALEKYVGNFQITERAQALYRESGLTKSQKDCSPKALQAAAEPVTRLPGKFGRKWVRDRHHALQHRLVTKSRSNRHGRRSGQCRRVCFRSNPAGDHGADDEDFSRKPDDRVRKIGQRRRDHRRRRARAREKEGVVSLISSRRPRLFRDSFAGE